CQVVLDAQSIDEQPRDRRFPAPKTALCEPGLPVDRIHELIEADEHGRITEVARACLLLSGGDQSSWVNCYHWAHQPISKGSMAPPREKGPISARTSPQTGAWLKARCASMFCHSTNNRNLPGFSTPRPRLTERTPGTEVRSARPWFFIAAENAS